ncbi:hypothetical protein PYW07_002581 [Mythimna separata]|uniref:HTH psq-type domain-containing protein n=1 Tax=Mythimna separata TaxID=271217 RepID=A0AAD7YGY1_MYTSE|nr:hypothetical protein PYW07_002581 [Mythimna separata]
MPFYMLLIEGRSGYRVASRTFSVPQSTLEDRVKKYRKTNNVDDASKKGMGRFKTVFTAEQESLMRQHIKDLEAQLFGLTYRDFRHLAFQMAEKNGIDHNLQIYPVLDQVWGTTVKTGLFFLLLRVIKTVISLTKCVTNRVS